MVENSLGPFVAHLMLYVTGSWPLADSMEQGTPGDVDPAANRVSGGATTTTSTPASTSFALRTLMLAGEKAFPTSVGSPGVGVVALGAARVADPFDGESLGDDEAADDADGGGP